MTDQLADRLTMRADPSESRQPRGRGARLPRALAVVGERYALVVLLAVVIVFFTILPSTSSTFPTQANLNAVLGNQSVVAILAIAAIFPLVAGYFDFTLGAVAGLSALVSAACMSQAHLPVWLAIIIGILSGTAIGAFNALLVAITKLDAFVVTLGVATLVTGLLQWYSGGQNIILGISPVITSFGSLQFLWIPQTIYLVALIAAASWFLLNRLPYGRRIQALGSNARAARLVGISLERHVSSVFLISGTLAGIAGIVMVARNGGAIANAGPDLLFPALAAVFLGMTAVHPGQYNVPGTILGVLFVAGTISGLTLAGGSGWVNSVFEGAILIIAVALGHFLSRRRRDVT